MTKHACPFNKRYTFTQCDKTKCPYHTDRASEFFNVEVKTKCIRFDMPEAITALSEASLSSLDATGFAKTNHRRIRRDVDEMLVLSRTIIQVMDEIPPDKYCASCGITGETCSSKHICDARLTWVSKVTNMLKIDAPNTLIFANIWKKLIANKLQLNDAVLERHGRKLLGSVNKA